MNLFMETLTKMLTKKNAKQAVEESHIVDKKTPFAIREAYKSLYTNVRYLNIEDKCKKIVRILGQR